MARFSISSRLVLVAAVGCVCAAASGADWIRPDWSGVTEPRFRPVALFGVTVNVSPLVYRAEIDVPVECDRATAILRTAEYAYVWVDGQRISAVVTGAIAGDSDASRRARNRFQRLDLSEQLTPGKHVIAVSASDDGFVLDGALYAGTRPLAKLSSAEGWTVTKFAPGTVLQEHPVLTLAYDGRVEEGVCGPPVEVQAVDVWDARGESLDAIHFEYRIAGLRRRLADAEWRLELMVDKGLYLVDHRAVGWGGPQRLPSETIADAGRMLERAEVIERELAALASTEVRTTEALAEVLGAVGEATADVRHVEDWVVTAWSECDLIDETLALTLADKAMPAPAVAAMSAAQKRRWLAEQLGLPVNRLNESRYDRLGWLPLPELADSDLRRWGVRVNPVAEPGQAKADRHWVFRTDPNDGGMIESRWRMSYPVDDRWTTVTLGHDWSRSADPLIASFKGAAWYRGGITIPAAWAGMPMRLKLTIAGDERVWINDREVTSLGTGFRKRTYDLPPAVLVYGGTNRIAVRVASEGPRRGMIGAPVATCPALHSMAGKRTAPVDVLATPLSPCVVLKPQTNLLHIHHGGTAAVALPKAGGWAPAAGYSMSTDRQLTANWILLWLTPTTSLDVRRPILLVFESNPVAIRCREGMTEIELGEAGQRVIAVRPWARRNLSMAEGDIEFAERISFWSRAARAVPINYMNLTKLQRRGEGLDGISVESIRQGPTLSQTIVYDYLETTDQWQTPALKIAPLPALASYAMDHQYAGLTIEAGDELKVLQDGGIAGPYRGWVGTDRVQYSYPIEPWPRAMGFTYRAPSSVSSLAETRLLAALGANSLRWRHTWGERTLGYRLADKPPATAPGRPPTPQELTWAAEMGYTHTLVESPEDRIGRTGRRYDLFVDAIDRHYGIMAQTLGDQPFDRVRYDLLDSPSHHHSGPYNRALRQWTETIRSTDTRHLIYIQPCDAKSGPEGLDLIEPTGDPMTLYGFREDRFTLAKASDRWPSRTGDIGDICRSWWPAIAFGIRNQVGLHCAGMGGGAPARTVDSPAQRLLLNDMLRVIDQVGMHAHFDSAEDLYLLQFDGALRPTHAARSFRAYFDADLHNRPYAEAVLTPSPAPASQPAANLQ